MATPTYMSGRKQYARPQGLLLSENPGTLQSGLYVPQGYEVNADVPTEANPNDVDQFLILSDHNRSPIDFSTIRIEDRKRMITGRMRSYHVADKKTISCSWDLLPSRSYSQYPNFGTNGKPTTTVPGDSDYQDGIETGEVVTLGMMGNAYNNDNQYTVDGGAGGVDLLDWYENHPGSFWVFLAYDKHTNFPVEGRYSRLGQYNEIIEVYFTDFSYSVVNRGGTMDLWNISMTLEEV